MIHAISISTRKPHKLLWARVQRLSGMWLLRLNLYSYCFICWMQLGAYEINAQLQPYIGQIGPHFSVYSENQNHNRKCFIEILTALHKLFKLQCTYRDLNRTYHSVINRTGNQLRLIENILKWHDQPTHLPCLSF